MIGKDDEDEEGTKDGEGSDLYSFSDSDESAENTKRGPLKSEFNYEEESRAQAIPSSISAIVRKPSLGVNQVAAGAGIVGLVGFLGLFLVAILFFITENYFISMMIMSVGLVVYVAGMDTVKILLSSFTVSFSSRHLIDKAADLVNTLDALDKLISLAKTKQGAVKLGPLPEESTITLPDNMLTRDLQKITEEGKDFEYAEYVVHSYYTECHELYSYTVANLEFVSDAMPLFGLIGTILGLIAMFDGLGADVSIESLTPQLALALKTTLYGAVFSSFYKIVSSRFDQRLKALEYDYETVSKGFKVLLGNNNKIEVKS